MIKSKSHQGKSSRYIKIINSEKNVAKLSGKVQLLGNGTERLEQYSSHNCTLIHRITKTKWARTDKLKNTTIQLANDLEFTYNVNDRTCRIRNKTKIANDNNYHKICYNIRINISTAYRESHQETIINKKSMQF